MTEWQSYKARYAAAQERIGVLEEENAILRDMLLNPNPADEPDNVRLHREKMDWYERALDCALILQEIETISDRIVNEKYYTETMAFNDMQAIRTTITPRRHAAKSWAVHTDRTALSQGSAGTKS